MLPANYQQSGFGGSKKESFDLFIIYEQSGQLVFRTITISTILIRSQVLRRRSRLKGTDGRRRLPFLYARLEPSAQGR